ncbi:hypothetical protein [Microbulbifer sp. TRSA005]|uniref:hypothetical protein n=3 Tax=Microbulbifer TaxID=48073 RepID=UPI00403A04B2
MHNKRMHLTSAALRQMMRALTHMSKMEDIEVYVKGNETTQVVSFLNEEIGALSYDCEIDEGHTLFTCNKIAVLINTGIQDGYISVSIKGAEKWSSDVEFARRLVEVLGVTVRCDPGVEFPEISPYSDIFVEINEQGESFLEWG